jgi:hypothetical protein
LKHLFGYFYCFINIDSKILSFCGDITGALKQLRVSFPDPGAYSNRIKCGSGSETQDFCPISVSGWILENIYVYVSLDN